MKHPSTFATFIKKTRDSALKAILTRARQSNHLAKILDGPAQQRAYKLKCHALSEAILLAPEAFFIDQLGITGPDGFRFHVPPSELTTDARAVLVQMLARLLNPPEAA